MKFLVVLTYLMILNDINVEEQFNFDLSDEILASVDAPSVNPVTTRQNAMPVMSGCVFNNCTFNM